MTFLRHIHTYRKRFKHTNSNTSWYTFFFQNLVFAYEPIWAIGTGKTCEANEANRICGLIRQWIGYEDVIIQYGGSVKSNNIDEIMSMSDIDGVLVGGASLDPTNFARIANYEKI